MAIGRKAASHPWKSQTILMRVRQASGVYAIFNTKDWIYVGESGDIRKSLLAHFDGDNACIKRNAPFGFQFELTPASERVARKKKLIAELGPICNRRAG
jgi:hypothetical protein